MASNRNISQNKPFANRKNVRSRLGPSYHNWDPLPFQKNSKRGCGLSGVIKPKEVEECCCGKTIVSDNFEFIGDGNSVIIWN